MSFYMTYLARWPDYFHVAEAPGNKIMGYSKSFFLPLFFLSIVSLNLNVVNFRLAFGNFLVNETVFVEWL